MRSVPFTAAAAAAGALLLLSACGGGSGSDAGKDSSAKEGPLEAYIKPVTSVYDDIDYEKIQVEQENIIAACMQEAGFEYTPQESQSVSSPWDDEDIEWGTEEFAQKYGYGYSGGSESEDGEDEWVDPNADYLATMSESERAAYEAALWGGPQDEPVDEDAEVEWDWTKAGCYGKASNETYGDAFSAYEDPAFVDLQDEMGRLYEKVQADPKLTALDSEWSACMNDAGFDFAKVSEASESISEAYNALWEAADPDTGGIDKTAEADLREKEMATAIADAKCQTKVGYQKKSREVQFALEQEFVDNHKAELDAWIEQYATEKAAK
ncbi:hypothetical protein [Cellulomonas chengniuliangii]|uniref:Uncharacterized protein n=1 Tax=Cellulomonas chengniuliangii TaxID=2968084 RepID=A0ABY5L286_9CELL|nr:hypothetical protein [Cellulomonas chengniuliangii]MCC2309746.1 hypothetical protein [Cellulomonas chengniuliangii]MCC2319042.1 hypothetical protein [Cellulomonas chengniuliangii]UUI74708.1 hypothetical protein NP064_13065 [Cellulomonas chengniuliangii]